MYFYTMDTYPMEETLIISSLANEFRGDNYPIFVKSVSK